MKTFTTNLSHFLTETGCFPHDIPIETRRFAEFLGIIVVVVSGDNYLNFPNTGISCIQQAGKHSCGGIIYAGFAGDLTEENIGWDCIKCGSSGIITDWQGTLWDMMDDADGYSVH